jgi:antitoxin component of MazEF toxin-antitoxin module
MVRKVTLRQVGGSIGAILPKDMADRLHVQAGDELFVVERTAAKYRNALRELSK